MRETETAASFAILLTKKQNRPEVGPDELLLGCLYAISHFGIAKFGTVILDLEEFGIDWLVPPNKSGAKVTYSQEVVGILDLAAAIAKADGSAAIRIDHLLAAFAREESGLGGELKRKYGINSAGWRHAAAQLETGRPAQIPPEPKDDREVVSAARDYLSPEDAAEALGIHVQTVRAYIRSGKLPALRLAGERAIRIRRSDLETVLEPLVPQG
jgi:excisionase family DNA binding protein